MSLSDLRQAISGEIFDYQTLMHYLREFKKPRDKVTKLLRDKSIVRIRQGLYIFGSDYQRTPISQKILANLIYGPSYISLEYALSMYGMIPERVYMITSISIPRSRYFKTPIGTFSYKQRSFSKYAIGIIREEVPGEGSYLIATREKALADLVAKEKTIQSSSEMWEHLVENLRIDDSYLHSLDKRLMHEISNSYSNKSVTLLYESIK